MYEGKERRGSSSIANVESTTASATAGNPVLQMQAFKTRLIAYFGRHDPARLTEVDSLAQQNIGKEDELMQSLTKKYALPYAV
jgi:hypothetical protein